MEGYCPRCREYRSDEGENAWSIIWTDYSPVCEKCGSVIDLFDEYDLDTDNDELSDGEERHYYNTDPNEADSDKDGLEDGYEVNTSLTDPKIQDSDNDGLSDYSEVIEYNTNPNSEDSDKDGLKDGEELNAGTNPLTFDSDYDLWNDSFDIMPNNFFIPNIIISIPVGIVIIIIFVRKSRGKP